MRFTPPKNAKAKLLSLCLVTVALLLFGTAFTEMRYRSLCELASLLFFVAGYELLFRYVMTTYTYVSEGEDFLILKRYGKKETTVCNISLRTGKALLPTPRTAAEKAAAAERFGRTTVLYRYCQTLAPKRCFSFYFDFNGENAEIVFEPDDATATALSEKIAHLRGIFSESDEI